VGKAYRYRHLKYRRFQALLFIAAYRLPGGLAAVIGAIQPLLVMLLAWRISQRSPWLAVFSAIAGILGMAMLLLSPHTVLDPLGIGGGVSQYISMALGRFGSPARCRVDRCQTGDSWRFLGGAGPVALKVRQVPAMSGYLRAHPGASGHAHLRRW
jgi:drug/metabolite transporter (DMT)-like permease